MPCISFADDDGAIDAVIVAVAPHALTSDGQNRCHRSPLLVEGGNYAGGSFTRRPMGLVAFLMTSPCLFTLRPSHHAIQDCYSKRCTRLGYQTGRITFLFCSSFGRIRKVAVTGRHLIHSASGRAQDTLVPILFLGRNAIMLKAICTRLIEPFFGNRRTLTLAVMLTDLLP